MSMANHPETDKQTERVNQCLESYLHCICFAKPKSCGRWLSMAQWWYKSSYHSAIKKSPFEALFGYPTPTIPALMNAPTTVPTVGEYLQQRQKVTQLLKKELTIAQNRMKP